MCPCIGLTRSAVARTPIGSMVTKKPSEVFKLPGLQLDNWVTVTLFEAQAQGCPLERPRFSK